MGMGASGTIAADMEEEEMRIASRWDTYFLGMAKYIATQSKDPSTKCGAVVIGPDLEVRSAGFNGFPRGIVDCDERLNDRVEKLKLVVHAEDNAILAAARIGVSLKGCKLYVASPTRIMSPCVRCALSIIQVGIIEVVVEAGEEEHPDWAQNFEYARDLLQEAGIFFRRVKM